MRFKKFTRRQTLLRTDRKLLARFLATFAADVQASGILVPAADLADSDYFRELGALLRQPERLPDRLNEALFAIDEMADAQGQEALERALAEAGLGITFDSEASYEDVALQVWLEAPALLARQHNQRRLQRLEAFEHFGASLTPSQRKPFASPAPAALEALTAGLDVWFADHCRGEETARLEVYPIAGDFWFLVRHGDTFARRPKVERQRTEVIHYRPEKDDVIVYSPEHDEIRINARTKGERQLYRRQFGLCLRGREDYFSEYRTYTLEPLRTDGPAALDPDGLDGIIRITLREVEVALGNHLNEINTRAADDLFQCGGRDPLEGAIPESGSLERASFDFQFADSAMPRPVEIRLPNRLKLGRHCDAPLVHRWLWQRGFRIRA
jgi:hypothetical protein